MICFNPENVEEVFRQTFNIPENTKLRFWIRSIKSYDEAYEELPKKNKSIQALSLMCNQVIIVEVQNEDGTWPKKDAKK